MSFSLSYPWAGETGNTVSLLLQLNPAEYNGMTSGDVNLSCTFTALLTLRSRKMCKDSWLGRSLQVSIVVLMALVLNGLGSCSADELKREKHYG